MGTNSSPRPGEWKSFTERIESLSDQLGALSGDVRDIRRAILGDEYAPEGLVTRVTECERITGELRDAAKRIKWTIIGALVSGIVMGLGVNDLLALVMAL